MSQDWSWDRSARGYEEVYNRLVGERDSQSDLVAVFGVALMARVPEHPAIVRSYACPPEWRMNPVTGEWVIVAPERSSRPMLLEVREFPPTVDEPCPFCSGHESYTPSE